VGVGGEGDLRGISFDAQKAVEIEMNGSRWGGSRTTGGARLGGHGQNDGEAFSRRGQLGLSD
jgi:hypothetical protein